MWHFARKFIDYLDTIPPLLVLIVAFTALYRPKRDFVMYYLVCQCLFNGCANILNELLIDNLFIYSLNLAWSYFILSRYFAKLYASQSLIWVISASVVLIQWSTIETVQTSRTVAYFDSTSFGIASLLMTLACLVYYARQLATQPRQNILTVRDFWYVNGIFTYYSSNFFIFLTFRTLTHLQLSAISIIWRIHNVVFLIMCIYFFIGLRCKTSAEKSPSLV
ncbi:hypothetical protein [Spirosoma gilvum]